jgi:hypothetical protein
MKNSDILSLQSLYTNKIFITEQEDITTNSNSKTVQATNPVKLDAIIKPPLSFSEVQNLFKQENKNEDEYFRLGGPEGSNIKKFKHEALFNALERNWESNLEKSKSEFGKYSNMFIFGDVSSGKTMSIKRFCNAKAEELGKAEAAHELYKLDPEFVENKTNYINFDVIQKSPKLLAAFLEDPSKYFLFFDFTLQQFTQYDFRGIPDLAKDTPYLVERKYPWLYAAGQPGATGVFFLDEFNRADPSIFNTMLPFLDDHMLGGVKVRDTIMIVAAGNISSTGASGGTVDLKDQQALMSRFETGYLVLDPFQWLKMAENAGMDQDIISFIKTAPFRNLGIQNQADETEEHLKGIEEIERGYKFVTPRNIEMFDQKYRAFKRKLEIARDELESAQEQGREPDPKKIRIPDIYETISDMASFACGVEWARRFYKFLRLKEKFNLRELANSPSISSSVENYTLPSALIEEIKKAERNLRGLLSQLETASDAEDSTVIDTFLAKATNTEKESYQDMVDIVKVITKLAKELQVNIIKRMYDKRFLPESSLRFFMNFILSGGLKDDDLQRKFASSNNEAKKLLGKYTGDEEIKARRGIK